MKPDLAARLSNHEDALVERKPEGANSGEIRATACGFANTVPPGSSAVIFFGVANDGTVTGVSNSDSLQKTIRRQLRIECYPPIDYQAHVVEQSGRFVVAVEIPASSNRPHFAGPAYVRRGSETVPASEQEYERLIASRNTVAGVLARAIGETWTVQAIGKKIGDTKPLQQPGYRESTECRIEDVNAHFVRLHHLGSGTNLTEELTRAELSYDEKKHRRMLIVRGGA
jgi:hypothetical protein